ncbi:hypothetical protein HK102_004185, partial [Quaeritorhiza haematococci]
EPEVPLNAKETSSETNEGDRSSLHTLKAVVVEDAGTSSSESLGSRQHRHVNDIHKSPQPPPITLSSFGASEAVPRSAVNDIQIETISSNVDTEQSISIAIDPPTAFTNPQQPQPAQTTELSNVVSVSKSPAADITRMSESPCVALPVQHRVEQQVAKKMDSEMGQSVVSVAAEPPSVGVVNGVGIGFGGDGPRPLTPAPKAAAPVLVVEDEPINRKIMVQMLRKFLGPSATIHEAADGTEAVDLCAKLVSPLSAVPLSISTDALPPSAPISENGVLLESKLAVAVSAAAAAAGLGAGRRESESLHMNGGVGPTTSDGSSLLNGGLNHLHPITDPLPTPPSSPTISLPPATSPQPLSIIFMDIIMPIMDGYTASEHIRRMGITTPIVVTTANDVDAGRGRELGVIEAIRKPFTRERVKGVLEKVGLLRLASPADDESKKSQKSLKKHIQSSNVKNSTADPATLASTTNGECVIPARSSQVVEMRPIEDFTHMDASSIDLK